MLLALEFKKKTVYMIVIFLKIETGNILSWGWNEHGNCGTGSQENVLKPSEVRMQGRGKATMIGSGACHSFVLLDTGEI